MVTPRSFGKTLRRLRQAKGLTTGELARAAGCSTEYIRRLESGRNDPTLGIVQALAGALGVPMGRLLE